MQANPNWRQQLAPGSQVIYDSGSGDKPWTVIDINDGVCSLMCNQNSTVVDNVNVRDLK